MSGNKAVLDSNAIIYASKQTIDVEKLLVAFDEFYVSIITYRKSMPTILTVRTKKH
jgi:rRNA-processing protein FCF1